MAFRRDERFHRYGPVLLAGAAILFLIAYEAARHHVVNRFDVLFFLVLVATVIPHEVAHGLVAYWCGDSTAHDAGRLSANPLRHVDPIGTVLLPILLIVTTGSAFGWAKPVPVSVNRLRHPRNQSVLVSLAGPAVNIAIAAVAGVLLHYSSTGGADLPSTFGFSSFDAWFDAWNLGYAILFMFGYVNVIIAAFNLIPIPPLDGSVLIERLLPASALPGYYRMRQASMILVLFVVFFAPDVLSNIFSHCVNWWEDLVF